MVAGSSGWSVGRFRRLDAAFRAGDLATLREELGLLDGFPNVIADQAMGSCLTYAVYHSPIALISGLLETGADPNWPDDDGFPPLIAALACSVASPGATVRTDVHQTVELLLAHGANLTQRGVNDYTPLHVAAEHGDLMAVDMLLAHGADPNERTRIDELETPLELAIAAGHADVVARLEPLTAGSGWETASEFGNVAELRRLLAAGHDVDLQDRYGQTALMRAAHGGYAGAVDWLIAHGAELDHTAKHNLSALMLAVVSGHRRIALALVKAGADTAITGSAAPGFQHRTAADLNDARGDKHLATFIRSHARPT